MAVTDKNFYTPYVIIHTSTSSASTGIFNSIAVISDDASDDATLDVIPIGQSSASTIKLSSGDTVYGPFTSYEVTAIDADTTVIVHEKTKIITN
jgi:hypothetical protein